MNDLLSAYFRNKLTQQRSHVNYFQGDFSSDYSWDVQAFTHIQDFLSGLFILLFSE